MRVLFCSLLLIAFANAELDHCYALALEGGGDKGAYQAGVLYEIINHHNDETVAYDIITGISVGAINGAGMANFEKGQEKEAADFILDLWKGLTKDQVYKNWSWGGIVRGVLFKTGIYNDKPLIDYLSAHVLEPKRKFLYGLVDAANGKFKTMDNTEPMDRYINGIVGSATVPGVFPVMDKLDEGRQYYDGGVAKVVDISNAVNWCKEQVGGDESKVTIDVLLNSGGTFKDKDASSYKAIRMGLRYLEIRNYYRSMDQIIRAQTAYKDVNFRYVVAPSYKLETGIIPFHFNPKEIQHNIDHGIEDAKQAIAMGEGKSVELLREYTKQKVEGKTSEDYGDFLASIKM